MRLILFVFLGLLAALSAFGQTFGEITGTVLDPSGCRRRGRERFRGQCRDERNPLGSDQ